MKKTILSILLIVISLNSIACNINSKGDQFIILDKAKNGIIIKYDTLTPNILFSKSLDWTFYKNGIKIKSDLKPLYKHITQEKISIEHDDIKISKLYMYNLKFSNNKINIKDGDTLDIIAKNKTKNITLKFINIIGYIDSEDEKTYGTDSNCPGVSNIQATYQ